MKKFFLNIFYFVIIVLLFNIVVFVFSNDNYYKGYNEFPSKDFHSFILADSHGMPLDKFSEKFNVYNFSSNSDSYADMKRKVSYLIENEYAVKTIYITADDHTLSPYRDGINNMDKSIIYTSKIDFNYIKEKYLKYYFPIFQLKVNGLFRIYLEDKVKIIFNQQDKTTNNTIWSELPEKEKGKRAEDRVLGQFPAKNKSKELEKTLREIINLCQKNHIELIGLKFPVSRSYLERLDSKNYGADKLLISKGLKIIDHKSVFEDNDGYFRDQDHLNSEGGKEFVKVLLTK
ncbi:hypothetical protein LUD75_11100 [Epilithonimonas sp. JDS]|uniref:hypothetical protein n=1 Tax=Epilithonimonas sp. JDS TaxID=2902797 RepID=UPI001E5D77AC|nr:hypothetical protein [Epilithonimonas sp. JDS]MCD9855258.1 hypothetical protein [Epilithonimonas sp. JDS]